MSRRIAGRDHRRHFVARINSRAQSPPSDIYVRRTYSGGLATPNGHRWDSRAKIRFAPDPLLEGTGFEPSVPRKASTGRKLLTPDHDEFIGRGLGAPDLALAPSKLPHAGVAVGERKGLETLGFGIEAQDRVCSPVADPHAIGVIDIDG